MIRRENSIHKHVRGYETQLKRINELCKRADQATQHLDEKHETRSQLKDYEKLRRQLAKKTETIKTLSLAHWREDTIRSAGPMAIWDVLAQKLEALVEKHES
jgi:hypothetical protein